MIIMGYAEKACHYDGESVEEGGTYMRCISSARSCTEIHFSALAPRPISASVQESYTFTILGTSSVEEGCLAAKVGQQRRRF
jgi:hypothetical protein